MRYRSTYFAAVLAIAIGSRLVAAAPLSNQERGGKSRPRSLAATEGSELRLWETLVTRMERAGELKLRQADEDTVLPGRRHERLDQFHRGVRVFGGDITREEQNGSVVQIMGRVFEGIDVPTESRLTVDEAVQTAERLAGGARLRSAQPELVVLPADDGAAALAWHVRVLTRSGPVVVLVDAVTGAERLRYRDLRTQSQSDAAVGRGRGVFGDEKKMSAALYAGRYAAMDRMRPSSIVTFDLKGNLYRTLFAGRGWVELFMSDVASDGDNTWDDGAVVDAHTYLGWTYDYFYKRLGRRGLDGRDASPVWVMVHPVSRQSIATQWGDGSEYFTNSWFCARCAYDGQDLLMFGEGFPPGTYLTATGQAHDYHAASLDVVSHEFAHGVTSYASRLIYRNESGALDEAFSDIAGTGAEFFLQPAGSGLRHADYTFGEDSTRAFLTWARNGSRSIADPMAYGDPDHYSRRYVGSGDNGGVHTNSTIASHAFYLAIEGGTNRTSGLSAQGVGGANREQIEKVFYRGFVYMLTSLATFSQARSATIQSARELYGSNSAAERAVTQAWNAVGVY